MTTIPDIRMVYRVVPLSSIIAWSLGAAAIVGIIILAWSQNADPDIQYFWIVIAAMLVRIAFLRTRIFIVTADGLTFIKRPLCGFLGNFDFFPTQEIRRIRYRLEKRLGAWDDDQTTPRMHY